MMTIGAHALRVMTMPFCLSAICIILGDALTGMGIGYVSAINSFIRQILVLLPLAYLFSRSGKLDLVWCAFPVAEVLAGALAGYFLWKAYRKVILPLEEQGYQF